MRVHFATLSDDSIASFRYRILIPSVHLARRGHTVSFGKDIPEDASVVVFSKHFNPSDYVDALRLKREGKKIVFDQCDLHDEGQHIDHYKNMASIADVVTVPTEYLAERIEAARVHVVNDPYEYPEDIARFRFDDGERLKLLWFGQANNLHALFNVWEEIVNNYILILSNPEAQEHCNVPIIPWSHLANLNALHQSDAVIIPVEDKPSKQAKSNNRMIESIRRGRFVIASPSPSHEEFREWMWVGNMGEGVAWVKEHKDEIVPRIRAAQEYVRNNYAPETIAKDWEKALGTE